MRGGHQAHIGLPRLHAAHPAEGAGLQKPQQLDLQGLRHIADLVQKQRAAVGGFNQAFLAHMRAGERAFFVAEQFALEQIVRQARAIDDHERPALTPAGLVHGMRKQLLAGARFAQQQHRQMRRSHALHPGKRLVERLRLPHQQRPPRARRSVSQRVQTLDIGDDLAALVEDGPQLHIHMLRPARRVMHMQHAIRCLVRTRLRHGAMLARLIAGHVVAMRDAKAFLPRKRPILGAELLPIRGIAREDGVVGIEHDHRLALAFQKRNQRLHLQHLRDGLRRLGWQFLIHVSHSDIWQKNCHLAVSPMPSSPAAQAPQQTITCFTTSTCVIFQHHLAVWHGY